MLNVWYGVLKFRKKYYDVSTDNKYCGDNKYFELLRKSLWGPTDNNVVHLISIFCCKDKDHKLASVINDKSYALLHTNEDIKGYKFSVIILNSCLEDLPHAILQILYTNKLGWSVILYVTVILTFINIVINVLLAYLLSLAIALGGDED